MKSLKKMVKKANEEEAKRTSDNIDAVLNGTAPTRPVEARKNGDGIIQDELSKELLKEKLIEFSNIKDNLDRDIAITKFSKENELRYSEVKKWIENYIIKQKRKEQEEKKKERQQEQIGLPEKERLKSEFCNLYFTNNHDKATELLVKYIEKNNNIYTTKNDIKTEIWIYREGIYVPQGKSEVRILLRDILQEVYSNYISNIIISKIETDTFIDEEKFFKNNYVYEIPLQNGILNIVTRELSHFSPKKIFFNKLPTYYSPEAKCPKINQFLSEVLADEQDRKVFYEIGGFGLLKEYTFEKCFMFVGYGRNGKGKSIELLKKVFGSENCCCLPLSMLYPESFDIFNLFGKMLNIAGDISSTDLKDTSMLKSATGRDLLAGKRKFLSTIYFENYAKMVYACNELPMVYDNSLGFWDRWILLEFPYTFVTKEELEATNPKLKLRNENIISEITSQEELSGLLNKFLNGLDRLRQNKRFSNTRGTQQIKDFWIRRANPFMAFCLDCLEESPDEYIFKEELRKEFSRYCKQHKTKGASDKQIKATLQELFGCDEKQLKNVNMNDGTTHNPYVWTGVKFKQNLGS